MSTIEEAPRPEPQTTGTKRLLRRDVRKRSAAIPDSRYEKPIDVDSNSTHARLVRLVGLDKVVLELGCSTGYMSTVLRSRGCRVTGIEIDGAAARLARRYCRRVITGDLDRLDFRKSLRKQQFDVILVGDVLEHLKDPGRVLSELTPFLAPNGSFVVSVPNVAHASVRLSLLKGNFDYTETGLLDRAHLRFFTLRTIQELLSHSGLLMDHLERVEMDAADGDIVIDRDAYPKEVLESIDQDQEARTYQFVFTAFPVPEAVRSVVDRRLTDASLQIESVSQKAALRQDRQQRALNQLQALIETQSDRIRQLERKLNDRELLVDQIQSTAESTTSSFRVLESVLRERTALHLKAEENYATERKESASRIADRDWTIASQKTLLSRREQELEGLRDQVCSLGGTVAALQAELELRVSSFQAAEAQLQADLESRALSFQNVLAQVQAEVESRDSLLAAERAYREALIAELAEREQSMTTELAEREQSIDALHQSIAAFERRTSSFEAKLSGRDQMLEDRDRVVKALNSELQLRHRQIRHLDAHSAQQADGIEWLRGEVRLRDFKLERIYRSRLWRTAGWYWRVRAFFDLGIRKVTRLTRQSVLLVASRVLPRRVKTVLRKFWNPWNSTAVPNAVPPAAAVAESRAKADNIPSRPSSSTYDLVCFSIIDWEFRWQRPQQVMSQFAREGHRVFFLKTTDFLSPGSPRSFEAVAVRDNVWEIKLRLPRSLDVYGGVIDDDVAAGLAEALADLRREFAIECAVSMVQVPTWTRAAVAARQQFGWKVVYDCMDEWNTFPGMKSEMLQEELDLVSEADLVCVSADRLHEKWTGRSRRLVVAKNGADFEHFAALRESELLSDLRGPIIGYFGAIAEWFDVDLLARVARERPEYSFVLIGGVFNVEMGRLSDLPNVRVLGQQPYSLMPLFLARFDVCIIPFVVNEVTAATDPVKFYEYISQGKPVVTTEFPELAEHRDLLYMARDADEFVRKLDQAVRESDENLRQRRIETARENTWASRVASMKEGIRATHPRVSIVVVSWNNVELTRLCLESIARNTLWPNFEVIVVDNASTDETRSWLESLQSRVSNLRLIFNDTNAGFAVANNQGLAAATGDVFILLNNDTVVPAGWLPRLVRHLESSEIGLVVAATNFSGNESRIDVPYTTLQEMEQFASGYMQSRDGKSFDIAVAAMYCVAMRRAVYERVGPLDEQFVVGMFEDDDYSLRVRMEGLRVICAEDTFVHHFGQASFGKLSTSEYQAIWDINQERYEKKWGKRWQPHTSRTASPSA